MTIGRWIVDLLADKFVVVLMLFARTPDPNSPK